MKRCPTCQENTAKHDPYFGILPCASCTDKQKNFIKPGSLPEFTTQDILDQRQEFMADIEQPHYKGALNKRFVEIYGEKAALDRGFTQQEIAHAEYSYDGVKGVRYYNDRT